MFSSSSMHLPDSVTRAVRNASFRTARIVVALASGVIPQFLIPFLVLSFFVVAPPPVFAAEITLPEIQNLVRQKKYDQALEKADAYLAPRPKDAQGRFIKGLILTELDRPNDAIAVFTQLTRDYPTLPEPYNNLAVLYAQQKQYDKARVALEMAIKTHPSYATAHENLGDVYAKLASQAYNKALQLDAGNTTAQSKLALIHDLEDTSGRNPAPTVLAAAPQAAQTPAASRTPAVPAAPVTPAAPPAKTLPITSPPPSPAVPAAPAKTPPATQKSTAGTTTTALPTPTTTVAAVNTPPAGGTVSTANPTAAQPAAKPAATPSAMQKPNNAETELVQATQRWASAWSKKDVKVYLAAYAPDFATPKGTTRKEWETERARRIDKPGKIEITLSNIQVSVNGDKARVKFRQRYKSASLASSTGKTLIFTHNGNQWLIQEERVD